ncbi:hypothetical protein E0493_08585 [Roseomonas sp. M0104]|uniref:DNA-binding protein n=1 Tax=Teichococcus coralli TaxID=2545983 RepID=A0A845BBB1_9PROT|nr:hypothetical protein [Pseudoroseomonas coralli]MXP63406.1 hypothetical protein [Pseudoroseomonas coralli]
MHQSHPVPPIGEASSARRLTYTPADPLLTAREAASETGRALSTFYRDLRAGLLPQPCVKVGRSPRWRRSVLHAALGLS